MANKVFRTEYLFENNVFNTCMRIVSTLAEIFSTVFEIWNSRVFQFQDGKTHLLKARLKVIQ